MGFKDVMKKVGKIGLMAAPYVAAPFTGGLSLAATGLANKAVNKWSAKDAANAEAKGLAPSKFDNILGKVGTVSSLASSFVPGGALGNIGKLSSAVSGAGKAANIAKNITKAASPLIGGSYNPSSGAGSAVGTPGIMPQNQPGKIDWEGMLNTGIGTARDVFANRQPSGGGYGQQGGYGQPMGQPMNQQAGGIGPGSAQGIMDQSNPNLAYALQAGRKQAIMNQPFRRGATVTTENPDDAENPFISKLPRIYPNKKSGIAPSGGGMRSAVRRTA
jgi:hypothetical protein